MLVWSALAGVHCLAGFFGAASEQPLLYFLAFLCICACGRVVSSSPGPTVLNSVVTPASGASAVAAASGLGSLRSKAVDPRLLTPRGPSSKGEALPALSRKVTVSSGEATPEKVVKAVPKSIFRPGPVRAESADE